MVKSPKSWDTADKGSSYLFIPAVPYHQLLPVSEDPLEDPLAQMLFSCNNPATFWTITNNERKPNNNQIQEKTHG